jgi:tetratricopeptide (TPR) repeat protein
MAETKAQLCFQHGMEEYQRGEYEKALSLFQKVISEEPNFSEALYNMSCCCAQLGNRENAMAYLGQAIRINPECREWAGEDSEFDTLKNLPTFQDLLAEHPNEIEISAPTFNDSVMDDFQALADSSSNKASSTEIAKSESHPEEQNLNFSETQKSPGLVCIRCGNVVRIEHRTRLNPILMLVLIYFGILLSLFIFLTWWGILGILLVMLGVYLFSLIKVVWVCPTCKAEGKDCGQIAEK